MLTASSDATIQIWDTQTAKPIGETIPFSPDFCPAIFGPDGRTILVGYLDGQVRSWNATTGLPVSGAAVRGKDQVSTLEFSGDGSRFAVGWRNGLSQLFDAVEFEPIGPAVLQTRAIKQILVNQDGSTWTTILNDGTIRSWAASTQQRGTPDEISLAVQLDTGLELDANQMRVEITLPKWNQLREQQLRNRRQSSSNFSLERDMLPDNQWHDARTRDAEETADWYTARWHLHRMIGQTSHDWSLHARLARTFSAQIQFAKAEAEYDEAARLLGEQHGRQLQNWLRYRAVEASRRKNWTGARWYLQRLIRKYGVDPDAKQQLQEVESKLGTR